jgi:hypothetical protein
VRLLRDVHVAVKALELGASDLLNADRRHANAQRIWFVSSYPDHEHHHG